MSFGQRVYSFIFLAIIAGITIYVPYHDPVKDRQVWAFAWETPTYMKPRNGEYESNQNKSEMEAFQKANPQFDWERLNKPIETPMTRVYFKRSGNYLVLLLGLAGWCFIPGLFDRLMFNYAQKQRAKNNGYHKSGPR